MVIKDDDEARDDVDYTKRSDDEEDEAVKGVSSDMFVPLEVDENLQKIQQQTKAPSSDPVLDEEVPVDESLFADDLDAELEGLEL